MEYSIYKLSFNTSVHFGNGRLSGSNNTFFADTLFSALYKEALKIFDKEKVNEFYYMVKKGEILLSDAMPYYKDTYFIPKPIITIKGDEKGDSTLKKKFKKLKYIPMEDIKSYIDGKYDPNEALSKLNDLGKNGIITKVAVNRLKDNDPYNIGIYNFNKEAGLYFIVGIDNEKGIEILDDIMDSLSYTGIGGKLSAGLGKFTYTYNDVTDDMNKRLNDVAGNYMSLSICMAKENELEKIIKQASYELIKRSGFVASEQYSDIPLKKKDFYSFKSGSCFTEKFEGDIYDISVDGKHEVYRYAKPMLMRL